MAIIFRNLFILFLGLAGLGLSVMFFSIEKRLPQRSYSSFLEDLKHNQVAKVVFKGEEARITTGQGFRYMILVVDPGMVASRIDPDQVEILFEKDYSLYFFQGSLLAVLASIGFVIWLSVYAGRSGERKNRFARDKLIWPDASRDRVTFADVAGVPEAKEELEEVVSFLKNPEQFSQLGAIMPKGLLLQGPPGTGKTLLARAIAGEAGVPFYSFSGSDFVEMFVGVGASRVRDLFREAKKNTPCIVFIDEIDAVGSSRVATSSEGQDERGQTLNALLVEMDGFGSKDNVVVLAATNRPDILDPALSRPGRFDRRITLLPPDVKGRAKILEVHCQKVRLAPEVDLEEIAKMTSGFSGAELASLVNEAALLAGRDECDAITLKHFDQARDRVTLGVERRGMILTDRDRLILAYHEAGHAILAKVLPDSDPVHKISIIPRGRALGQTQQLPLGDRTAYSKRYLTNRIITLMGGRAAEEIVFDVRTTQTENDLLQATEIATNMICRWGMSEGLGPQSYMGGETGFLGESGGMKSPVIGDAAVMIDREIKILLSSCYKKAVEILKSEKLFLKTMAEILVQVETLDAEEFEIIYQCAVTKKAQEEGRLERENECSVCPGRSHCLQFTAN